MTAAANSIDDKGDTAGGALVSRHYESTTKTIAQRDRGTEEYREPLFAVSILLSALDTQHRSHQAALSARMDGGDTKDVFVENRSRAMGHPNEMAS